MKHLLALCMAIVIAGPPAFAGSFVGNGGNAGDVELLVAKKEVRETAAQIAAGKDGTSLCECAEAYENNAICTFVKNLNSQQAKFCSEVLAKNASRIAELAQDSSSVRFLFTHEPIETRESEGGTRASDAVADRSANQITINQQRFLAMNSSQRIFLLAHEISHFTDWQEKPLVDEGAIGPFTGPDGARHLINAMAAATVMRASDGGVIENYRHTLNRPQSWKKIWLDVDIGSVGLDGGAPSSFGISQLIQTQVSARYYFWNGLGVIGSLKFGQGSQTVLDTITASETTQIFALGAVYRIFPFSDPLTYFGQTYFDFQAVYNFVSAKYSVDESPLSSSSQSSGSGPGIGIAYDLPLFFGLWGRLGMSYDMYHYGYTVPNDGGDLNYTYNSNRIFSYAGVSYGF